LWQGNRPGLVIWAERPKEFFQRLPRYAFPK